jgi:hypothetical protein
MKRIRDYFLLVRTQPPKLPDVIRIQQTSEHPLLSHPPTTTTAGMTQFTDLPSKIGVADGTSTHTRNGASLEVLPRPHPSERPETSPNGSNTNSSKHVSDTRWVTNSTRPPLPTDTNQDAPPARLAEDGAVPSYQDCLARTCVDYNGKPTRATPLIDATSFTLPSPPPLSRLRWRSYRISYVRKTFTPPASSAVSTPGLLPRKRSS